MTTEQQELIIKARESSDAAKLLHDQKHYGFAVSRAYYAMFYIAEAFLLGEGLAYSKHSAVHAAFGEHFSKTGRIPKNFHRYLIHAMEMRHTGDYGRASEITEEDSEQQISRAKEFLELAERLIGPINEQDTSNHDASS